MTALEILKKYWQHDSFRQSQAAIIDAVLSDNNVVTILPTGAGKSVCYQVPAMLKDGVCIVISPLIALMQDQVSSLIKKGIKAIAISSKLREHELVIAFDNMLYGNVKFVYLSPEKLKSEFIQQKIKQLKVSLIAIDEAHCISQWGHDFRPSYLEVDILNELQPNTPIIALTATATNKVSDDIINLLNLNNPIVFKETIQRKNLAYQVFETENIYYKLQRILTKNNYPTIIYVNTRKKTKVVSDYLNNIGFKCGFYHGALSDNQKEMAFNNWMTEKTKIIVATNAFGMGIDKNNVKVVVHIEIPNSIENYMQEAGRAGRSGNKSFSVLLYNDATIYQYKNTVKKNNIDIDEVKKIYKHLNRHLFVSKGELSLTNYTFNLQDFCTKYKLNSYKTYAIIKVLEKEEVLIYNQSFNTSSTLIFKCENRQVLAYINSHINDRTLIQLLLRSYGGVFENKIRIDEAYLAKKLSKTKHSIISQLKNIEKNGIIEYDFQSNVSDIQFLVMREDNITINRISKSIKQRNKIKADKADAILNYIENDTICRNKQLLAYFNEKANANCMICDVCIAAKSKKNDLSIIASKILHLLDSKATLSSKEIVNLLQYTRKDVINTLQFLLEQNKIILTNTNSYKIK